ncbi:MAG TPA: lipid II flippase MurJ, partial [Patescibacteria group bacterium]|nr:lipid II flippase MurJ [Patescibacteria group bacterium]
VIFGGNAVIADILGILSLAILFRSIYHIASRSFYARQDTKTPLYISIAAIALNIVLAAVFVLKFNFGVVGLAAAQSIVALFEVAVLFSVMSRNIRGLFDVHFVASVVRMFLASTLMFVVTYVMVKTFDLNANDTSAFALIPKFSLIVLVGFISYLILSQLLKLEEAGLVIAQLKKLAKRPFKPIEPVN